MNLSLTPEQIVLIEDWASHSLSYLAPGILDKIKAEAQERLDEIIQKFDPKHCTVPPISEDRGQKEEKDSISVEKLDWDNFVKENHTNFSKDANGIKYEFYESDLLAFIRQLLLEVQKQNEK